MSVFLQPVFFITRRTYGFFRNIDYWYDEITIDKGSKSGITKGMAVVNNSGLLGQITSVSNYYSTVKLLANENMSDKISVKISY